MEAKWVMWGILALLILLICVSLYKRDKDPASSIRLEDILLGPDGRVSKAAVVMFGAFGLTTWMMVFLTVTGRMTEGYFGLYAAAWITPSVIKLIVGDQPEKTA